MTRLPLLAGALLLTACGAEPRAVTADDPDVARIALENNAFTLDMHQQLSADGGNVFHSPFSMNAALSMTYAGAQGTTASEMAQVLHIEADAPHHEPLGALIRDLDGARRRAYSLDVANRIWGQDSMAWNADFLALNEDAYGAPTVMTDFAADPEGAREEINGWVKDTTHDKIPELLPPGIVNTDTVMVLANAVYFKADWAEAFDKADTSADPFHRADESVVDVDTMHGTLDITLGTGEGFVAAGLPYGEDAEVRMWVVLPNEDTDLVTVESSLTAESLDIALDDAVPMEANVALPKLELRTKARLKDALTDLGMPTAFSDQADFGAMLEGSPQGPTGIKIDEVVHEAYVKIDEEGTEAAAATAVVMGRLSADPEPYAFTVDRPYLFLIRDELTGTVLFIGRVADPSTASAE